MIIDYLSNSNKSLITKDNFDIEVFNNWYEVNEIGNKNNPSVYLNKCFEKELNKGTFMKVKNEEIIFHPKITPLYNTMRELGIKVIPNDTVYIETLICELVGSGMPTNEVVKTNHYIVENLMKSGDDTTKFIELWKKSRNIKKYNICLAEVETKAQKQIKEWDELLSYIQSAEEKD